jgi:hypothetical protein
LVDGLRRAFGFERLGEERAVMIDHVLLSVEISNASRFGSPAFRIATDAGAGWLWCGAEHSRPMRVHGEKGISWRGAANAIDMM